MLDLRRELLPAAELVTEVLAAGWDQGAYIEALSPAANHLGARAQVQR